MPELTDIDDIEDEDLLHKMLGETEEFDDRRKIRARLREIREKRTGALAAKKQTGPQIPAMAESSEEAVFRSTKTEKAESGGSRTTTTTTTKQTSKDGTTTTVKQSKQVTQTGGPGSTNIVITKTSAAKSGPRGALSAFQQMDNASSPSGGNPNAAGGLSPTSPTTPGGGRVAVQRSPSAIKQMLLDWCVHVTRGYEHVNITNFSSSWNDGMAFCAIMHHFYPRAFDYNKLNPKCRRGNFKLAFDVAEKLGGVAPLLDVDDMVKMKNPDWKCVFTYVQALYRRFRENPNNAQKADTEKGGEEGSKDEEVKTED